ncbi:YpjP family protein [Texcoconibacillus texcoconensis]|uniref:YpjP-like protein n=1 Tax=Texcoconibacillus texcoconensis TaxID=1095777 RepID=A0A840QMJ6_9BACI|nr:YpjP family protein [Texcoconibacillus texcoconensis]MBB5172605.1 hypothetical protein [Texcoconibacillus texcoconensis]
MKLWLKKISVVLITLMTVGMYIPPTYLDGNAESSKAVSDSEDQGEALAAEPNAVNTEESLDEDSSIEEAFADLDSNTYVIDALSEQAVDYTMAKLGPKIIEKVEDDVMTTILPNIEEVLEMLLHEEDPEKLKYLSISELGSSPYGEKIFHLYDDLSEEEIAMFHVRRDKKPKDGYWFNFHYHLSDDDFEEHYNIGDVYWDKNTPPKWMSS